VNTVKTEKEVQSYLTETILTIHNEIQSAIDYIKEMAPQAGTELGRSTAIMNIERVRIQLPIRLSVERRQGKVEELPGSIAEIRRNLATRKGFLIEGGEPGKRGIFTKVLVNFRPQAVLEGTTRETPATGKKELEGEIELIFIPQRRD
jgi:hypothetical protein